MQILQMLFVSHKQDERMWSWAFYGVIAVFLSAIAEEDGSISVTW